MYENGLLDPHLCSVTDSNIRGCDIEKRVAMTTHRSTTRTHNDTVKPVCNDHLTGLTVHNKGIIRTTSIIITVHYSDSLVIGICF